MSTRIVVLISGNGSNLQALLDACARQEYNAEIVAVICNVPTAYGLQRAVQRGVETRVIDHKAFADRTSFDAELFNQVNAFEPDWVILAGFMRILDSSFVQHFKGRLLNIHPSLLPNYPGLHTHKKALAAGDKKHGCSVHFVTAELDGGPVIGQASVPILATDTESSLAQRVHHAEHILYPRVVAACVRGDVRWHNQQVNMDEATRRSLFI